MNFPCTRCGACCRNVHLAVETKILDRGDGSCIHYDDATKLCSIYDQRPAVCRVDVQFHENYSQSMTWETFCALNLEACKQLMGDAKQEPS